MSNVWTDMDPDDIPGYIMDDLATELSVDGHIMSKEQFMDAFRNDQDEWALEILLSLRDAMEAYHE